MCAGFEPLASAYMRDPFPALRRLRRESPVFFYEPMGFWVLTRYADVVAALTDFETFSSRAFRYIPPPAGEPGEELAGLFEHGFVNLDPPEHTVSRKNANKALTRGRVAQMAQTIREIADQLIDRFIADGEGDLMQQFCYPFTLGVIVQFLGLPAEDMPLFRQWTDDHFALMTPLVGEPRPMDAAELRERWGRIRDAYAYYAEAIEERRRVPTDDLISAMVGARDDDGSPAITTDRIILHIIELNAAGNDTTANLIGNMVMFLSETPGQAAELLLDDGLLDNAIEEGIRRRPPSTGMFRRVTRDVELSGTVIPLGSTVLLAFRSACHDDDRFPGAQRFDPRRANAAEHVGLGQGRHFCMGAPLARLEARTAIRALYERLPDLAPLPDQELNYLPVLTADVLEHLQVRWSPATWPR